MIIAATFAVVILACPLAARAQDATVTVTPFPAPTTTTFDPAHPPANPPLREDNADTVENIGVIRGRPATTVDPSGPDANGDFTVTANLKTGPDPATISAMDTIRIPQPATPPSDADQQLLEHEQGHATLDKNDYDKSGKMKTEDAFRGLNGMKFIG